MTSRNGHGASAPIEDLGIAPVTELGHMVMACTTVEVVVEGHARWVALIGSPHGLLHCTMPEPSQDNALTMLLPHITEAQRRPLGQPRDIGIDEAWVENLLDDTGRRLRQYFRGAREAFDVPVDWSGVSAFMRATLEHVHAIPYGEVRTYGAIAREIGKPGASRAVGQAIGANPVPLIVPCHRVVAANGLGGFGGGLDWKRRLLALEGVHLA